jgi:hypothetical protein
MKEIHLTCLTAQLYIVELQGMLMIETPLVFELCVIN